MPQYIYFLAFLFTTLFFSVAGGKKFSPVTTFLPVLDSNAKRAFFAIAPPFLPAMAFFLTPFIYLSSASLIPVKFI